MKHDRILQTVYQGRQEIWRKGDFGAVFYVGRRGELFPAAYHHPDRCPYPSNEWNRPEELERAGWTRDS